MLDEIITTREQTLGAKGKRQAPKRRNTYLIEDLDLAAEVIYDALESASSLHKQQC